MGRATPAPILTAINAPSQPAPAVSKAIIPLAQPASHVSRIVDPAHQAQTV